MLKGILRFLLSWGLSVLLTPPVRRVLDQLAARAPSGSFLKEVLLELADTYSTQLVQTLGETAGELALGSK